MGDVDVDIAMKPKDQEMPEQPAADQSGFVLLPRERELTEEPPGSGVVALTAGPSVIEATPEPAPPALADEVAPAPEPSGSLLPVPDVDLAAASERAVLLELAAGVSTTEHWRFDDSVMLARIDVGSSPDCEWQVWAPGVERHHFHVCWDGSLVAGREVCCKGDVTIDGLELRGWRRLTVGAEIRFGAASFRVREDHGDRLSGLPDIATIEGDWSLMAIEAANRPEDVAELPGDATVVDAPMCFSLAQTDPEGQVLPFAPTDALLPEVIQAAAALSAAAPDDLPFAATDPATPAGDVLLFERPVKTQPMIVPPVARKQRQTGMRPFSWVLFAATVILGLAAGFGPMLGADDEPPRAGVNAAEADG